MSYTATVNVTTGIFHKTSEELNGFEEMMILLPNTPANRIVVGTDRDCTLVWSAGPVTLFEGKCTGAKFTRGFLECSIYNTAYEQMQRAAPYTATFDVGADVASDVLTALGAHVGIAVSWDPVPDPAIGVVIDIANPMDVLIWLAEVTGNDFWVTYGPLTLHIGARGAARGVISVTDGSTRIIDRSQQRDRIVIRGWDADGNELTADTAGGGTRYARFVHKRPVDQATLDALAAQKLVELNKDDGPSPLIVTLAAGNTTPLYPGDTVTITQADLGLPAGDYRIFKIERYLDRVVIHPEVWDASTDRAIWDTRKYEDLGIYAVGIGQIPKGSQQWNSDVEFSTGPDPHDDLAWAAGTISYADGDTQVITALASPIFGLAVGVHFIYWRYGISDLQHTAAYATAVGPDKGIIAKVTVSAETTDKITIETFYASGTSIGEGTLDPTLLATPAGWVVGDIVESAGLKSDGTISSKFTVTIPVVVNATLYAFGYKINGTAGYIVITSDSNVIVVEGLRAGIVYNCRAAAISKLGEHSAWTATVNKTASGDAVAPDAPTGLAATSKIKSVLLEWNENSETDLDHYEVHMDDGGYAIIAYVRTNYYTFMATSAQLDTAYNFKIKAVDHTGNKSGFSGIVAGTPIAAAALDLKKGIQKFDSSVLVEAIRVIASAAVTLAVDVNNGAGGADITASAGTPFSDFTAGDKVIVQNSEDRDSDTTLLEVDSVNGAGAGITLDGLLDGDDNASDETMIVSVSDGVKWTGANPAVWFADETTQNIANGSVQGLGAGTYWAIFTTGAGVTLTGVYANAVGDEVGILARVTISTTREPFIFPVFTRQGSLTVDFLGAGVVDTIVLTGDALIGKIMKTSEGVSWADGVGDPGVIIERRGIKGKGAGGVLQALFQATDGKILAGAGTVILDADGVTIKGEKIEFQDSGGVRRGTIFGVNTGAFTIFSEDFILLLPGANGTKVNAGPLFPGGDGTQDFGKVGARWDNIYAVDLWGRFHYTDMYMADTVCPKCNQLFEKHDELAFIVKNLKDYKGYDLKEIVCIPIHKRCNPIKLLRRWAECRLFGFKVQL